MIVRRQIVYRAPGSDSNPMIRIVNKAIADMGFNVGTSIEITYAKGEITIRKLHNHHEINVLQQEPSGAISHPTASGAED